MNKLEKIGLGVMLITLSFGKASGIAGLVFFIVFALGWLAFYFGNDLSGKS